MQGRASPAEGTGVAKVIRWERAYMLIRQKVCVDGGQRMKKREEKDEI